MEIYASWLDSLLTCCMKFSLHECKSMDLCSPSITTTSTPTESKSSEIALATSTESHCCYYSVPLTAVVSLSLSRRDFGTYHRENGARRQSIQAQDSTGKGWKAAGCQCIQEALEIFRANTKQFASARVQAQFPGLPSIYVLEVQALSDLIEAELTSWRFKP